MFRRLSMDVGTVLLIRGIVGIAAGILAMFWPGLTLAFLVALFGVYAFIDGVINVAVGVSRAAGHDHSWATVIQGVVGMAAGVLAFAWPNITLLVLLFWIAAWAVVTGVFELVAAVRLRRIIEGEWMLALSGTLSIALGIILFARPAIGAIGLAWALGAYAAATGIVLVGLGIRLRTMPVFA
jgi:uncharacterized membrane protein HdeD (DUF308 family)